MTSRQIDFQGRQVGARGASRGLPARIIVVGGRHIADLADTEAFGFLRRPS